MKNISKLLFAATVFCVATSVPVYGAEPIKYRQIEMENSLGGGLADFLKVRETFKKLNFAVKIKGYCASACQVLISLPGSCAMPGATLVYHPAFWEEKKNGKIQKRLADLDIQALYLSTFPEDYANFIITNHLDAAIGQKDETVISDATQFMMPCNNE